MRPIKLSMQAFGPYAGVEMIDFTSLGNRTMFVISGKTGSGKTTIFDAISYAIYGKASGEDRSGPELRSQFAKDELLTEVSLQFSLRGKNYFITRSPQQDKKKERGDGVRTIGAKAELYVFNDVGEKLLLAANVRDVDEKIKEIMLIDSNQFRQILMIPQGEFRKLLTSDSKDKEVILQRLFHTEIYKKVEEKLRIEATELKVAVEKQVEDRHSAIKRIHALYSDELKNYVEANSVNDTLIFPLLLDELTLMSEQLTKLAEEVAKKQASRDQLQQKLFEAENLAKQLKSREELGLRKQQLEADKEVYQLKEQEIVSAQKAALLAQQEELCHRLKRELDEGNKDLEARKSHLESLTLLLKSREEAWLKEKDREDERKSAQEAVNQLQHMKEDVQSFAVIQKEVSHLEKELNETKTLKSSSEDRLKRIEEALQSLAEEKSMIEKSQLTFLENERKVEKYSSELDLLVKLEKQMERQKVATQTLSVRSGIFNQVDSRLKDAKILLEDLENKWLKGQASILASHLHDGEACPVCGSEQHPHLATSLGADIPTEEDLKAAKKQGAELELEKSRAESALYEARSEVSTVDMAVQELADEIKKGREHFTLDELSTVKNTVISQRDELLGTQKELQAKMLKLEKINANLEKGQKEKELAANFIHELTEKLNNQTIAFTEKNTNLNRMLTSLPEHLRSVEAFELEWKKATVRHETLLKLLEQTQKEFQETAKEHASKQEGYNTVSQFVKEKEQALNVEKAAFVEKMSSQGFENYGSYHGAKRSDSQIQQLEMQIRRYREELRSVTDRFNELTLLLQDAKEPDLEGLNAAFAEANKEITELNEQYNQLFMKKRDNEDVRDKITSINEHIKTLEDRYKLVGHLFEIAKGQNTYRVTFERFVLAAFLDDILQNANGRLSKMTSGRYQLLRKTDRSKGNVQSGLELLVFDQYTGQERHVKTLSGGESFKAALSLALGLADVVQQYAGGVSLETMFIDEGFGTLDPESLDQAIEALIDIQSSGRLVGIISHVPELKERIDARLEVYSAQTGSRTEFVFMN
ncbi:SMC family ATPase [Bacillus sp. 31A1R]|uniref:Nuclease SbcCD subunit C n=1 Tax=Robertmurraya mangrovi TaxID=3098077 RepID=A0ABU5J0V2_9BACI|nr:SMC family ATPase [Bacillus sp. 31A1R]MDZ5473033.1 SMC family ATPase [Bacillus sp. 31A1R]